MAKDPAFLFYYQDFLVGTDDFTNEAVGAYIRCLCIQAAKGGISENHMIKICESQSNHEIIKKKFVWYPEEKVFRNDRLSEEVEKRRKYSESRSKNKKGKHHVKNTSVSYDQHMENEDENSIRGFLESKNYFNGESDEEKNAVSMLVPEMEKVWLKYKPEYSSIKEVDYPALVQIAYYIAGRKGWSKHSVLNIREMDVLDSWEKIAVFLTSDKASKWFKKLTLDTICNPKNMQKIEEEMKGWDNRKQSGMVL